MHYATLAKLEHLLEHPKEAITAATKAMRVLSVTHAGQGAVGGQVCEEVGRVGWEAQQELAAAGAQ